MMNTRLNILRNYETYCYQICYHMLRDERLAVETAKQALIDVYQEAEFFGRSHRERQEMIRRIAVRRSLQAYVENETADRIPASV